MSPVTILGASLLAWWTADRADLITLNSTAVTSWKDVVAGYDAVQGVSAARPTYSASSFNGAPGLTFDGVDDELTLASQPFPSGASPSEIWAVAQNDALAGDVTLRRIMAYGGGSSVARYLVRSGGVTNDLFVYAGNGSSVVGSGLAGFNGRKVARGVFQATTVSCALDGTPGPVNAVVPATAQTRARIGAHSDTVPSGFWNGKIRDVLVTGPLSVEQITANNAWALPRRML